jgi:2'-hydroxybiphenyl-2-sulfinate desulfinase
MKEFRYTICPVGNASFISANKDGFLHCAFEKLCVKPVLLQNLPETEHGAHYTHSDPALFREGGNIPPIWATSNGAGVVLLGLAFLRLHQYVFVRADSHIATPEDLRGARLGIPFHPDSLIDFFKATVLRGFHTMLKDISMHSHDVEFVPIEARGEKNQIGRAEIEALDNGKTDAVFMLYAYASRMIASGKYRAICDLATHPASAPPLNNEYPNVLTVSRQLADSAPGIVVEYIKQTILAARWARDNPDETAKLFARQLRSTPEEAYAAFLPGFHEYLEPCVSEQGMSALENQKCFLLEHGFIKHDFDVWKWLDDSFLKAALSSIETDRPSE